MAETAHAVDWALAVAALVTAVLALGGFTGSRCSARTTAPRMTQVAGFLMLGVVATLIWLRLGSVDVALAEAGLGGGILGAVLVCCAVGHRRHSDTEDTGSRWVTVLAWLCGTVLVVVLSAVWLRVEESLPAWTRPVQDEMADTGVDHGITAVLLAFRAYDTLLESAVLMLAGLAVLAVRPVRPGDLHDEAAPQVNATLGRAVRIIAPVLVLAGLWLLFAGSSDSGGAFQSGAVLAAVLILLHIGGVAMHRVQRALPALMVIGVAAFLVAAVLGPLGGAAWLAVDPSWSFAVILGVEILLTVGIAAALYAIFAALGLPAGRPADRPVRHGVEEVRR